MRKLIISALLALASIASAAPINVHNTEAIMATDGSTVTDTQIQAVLDYETTLLSDPDPIIAEEAAGWVNICNKALANNPKDRSKVAFQYDALVAAGTILAVV